MDFFKNIRNAFGKRLLNKSQTEERQTIVHNFGDARKVALLYREKGESYYILVKQYVRFLREEYGIREVMALCYIENKKQVPHYHKHKLKFDFFTGAEVNFFYQPKCDQVKNFVVKDYDILIDLEKDPCLPLQFVLSQSRAKFKVGRYSKESEKFYDLMLQTSKENTFDEFIKQVNHYLNLINSGNVRA